jgi:hypothetical protein
MEDKSKTTEKVRITGRMLKAFQMKYDGSNYEEIATATRYSFNYITKQFGKARGQWHAPYVEWERDTNDEVIREAKEVLRKGARNAAKIVIAMQSFAKTDPRLALAGAQDTLDRVGLKPTQEVLIKDKVLTVAEEMAAEIAEQSKVNENDK